MTLRKTCSIITTIAFCLTQPVLPIDAAVTNLQPSSNKPDAITFQLPSDMGYITQRWGEESFDQENKPIILHIQDAHVDYLAQRNIAKIIQHVQNYIRLHHPDAIQDENLLVAVEGAQGFISTQFYTNLPDDDIRHHVSDHFLRKGELTGPEYQAIVGALPFDIYGVENSDLYLKHKDNYLRCQNSKIEIMQFLEVFEKELEIITQEFVGEGGRHFLTNKRSYIDGSLEFEAYCTYLTKEASQLGILWQQISPNIVLLSKLMEMQSSVDLEKLQTQTARLVEQLSKNLPREEVKSLVKQTLHYRLGKMSLSYYRYLNGLLETDKGADTDPYAQARLYTRLLENMAKIDHSALNHEIENLESQIQTGLFQSLDERKVFSFINYLSLLKDLVSLKMNRKTLQMVREESNHISKSYFQEFLDAYVPTSLIDVPDIELITKPFLEFYRIAEARDLALAHNTLDELEKRQSHVAVLLTGGFHTEGLEKQFRKRDVSYLVLMPNSDGFSEKTEEIYQSRMKGALSGLNAKMIQSAQTLHPGSLLKPIMNNPALAKQLESIMRSAFALTSGSLALAKGEDLSRLFESWRVATSNAYAELRELSFFGEDIQIGNSRIILARKGNTVIAFQFAAKDKIDEIVVPDEAVMDAGLLDGIAVRVFNPSVLDPETLPLAAKAFIEASLPGQTDIWDPALTDEKLYAYFRGKVFHWLGQGVQMKAYEYGDTVLKIPYERMFLEGDEAELIHGNPFLRTLRNIFKRYLDGTRVGAFIREGLPRMLNVVRPRKGSNVNKTIDTYRLGQRRLEGLILPYRIIRSGSFQFESDLMGRMGLSGKVASAQEEWGVLQKKADRFLFDEFKNKVDEGNIEGAKQLLRDLVALQTKLWRRGVFDWDAMNFGQNYAYNSDQGILMLDPGNISDSFDELRTYISGRASFARQVQRDLSAGVPLNDILNQIGPELRAQLWDIIAALRLIRDQFSTEVARELADTLLESLLQTLTFENANALWKLDIIAPTAGAMKVPGSGEAFAYKVSQDTVDIVLDAIKARAPPEVYKDIPITEADQEDFVSFDQNAQEITVRPDLWRLIQFRQRTHHILQRHEYVENILIPQLIDEGLLQAADRLHAHAITSRVDAVLEETSNHLLMPIFVRLMRIEELRAIAADHPNDADRAFYLEVQTELSRREARAEETQGLSIFSPQSMSLADQHPNRTMMTKFLDDSGQTRTAEYVDQLLPYVSGRLVEIPVELGEGKHIFSVDRLLLQDLEITEEAFAALIIEAVKLDEDVNGFHYWTLPENVSILYVESSTNMIEVSVEPNLIGFNRGLFDTDLSREDLLNLAKLSMARGLRPMTLTDELVLIRDAYAKMHISGYYINQILLEFGRKGIVSALQISKDTDQYHRALEKVNTARDKALFKALLKKRSADQIRSLRDKLSFLFSPSSIYHALLRNTYWLRVLTEAVTLRRPDIGAFKVPGTASSQYQAIVDPTIISTIVSRLNPTEYEAIPFQADSSFNRAQFHDLAHYDASAGLIRVHPRLYYKKNAEGDSVSTDLEAQRILRRHEYVENVLIPRLVQEGFISIPSGISAHAVATVVDTQIEGSPLHALMQYTLLGMNNEELEAISPDHPNDPDQVFYNAAQRLLEDRILKQSLKLETRGQIGQRDTEVIEKAFLGRIAAVDRESSYVAESIRSLFGVEIDTRQIQEIRVKLFSDDGKNKRVYRVDVKGELQLGGLNKQYSFLFKVFRPDPDDMDELSGRKPVTQEDRARARRSSYSLKAAGIHPENGPDQTIELDSGERVDVFTEGIVDGQTVVDLRRDLQKLRNQKLISEDVFQQRIRRLYRMSLIAILQMWLILGGRYILDPTGYNLMLQGSFERGYRPIFIDLDRVTKDPVALVDVMDVLVRRYAHRPGLVGDALQDVFGHDEALRIIHEMLHEIEKRKPAVLADQSYTFLQGDPSKWTMMPYIKLEELLKAYLSHDIQEYQRIPLPGFARDHSFNRQAADPKLEWINPAVLGRFRELAKLLNRYLRQLGGPEDRVGVAHTYDVDRLFITDPLNDEPLNIDQLNALEKRSDIGARRTAATLRKYFPYRRRIASIKGVARTGIRTSFKLLNERVMEALAGGEEHVVVRIGGREGVGKETLANAIAKWGLGTINPSQIAVIHADDAAKPINVLIDEAKSSGKKLILVEGFYSLRGQDHLFDDDNLGLDANIHIHMETHEDTRVQRLTAMHQNAATTWLRQIDSDATSIDRVRSMATQYLSGMPLERVLKIVNTRADDDDLETEQALFFSAKRRLMTELRLIKIEEISFMFDFIRLEDFVDRYSVDQERSTADIIIKNDQIRDDFGVYQIGAQLHLRSLIEDAIDNLSDGLLERTVEVMTEIFRSYPDNLWVLTVEDALQLVMNEEEDFVNIEVNAFKQKLRDFLSRDERGAFLLTFLMRGLEVLNTSSLSTRKAIGQPDLTRKEARRLLRTIATKPVRDLNIEDMHSLGVNTLLSQRGPPEVFRQEHTKIKRALLTGEPVPLTKPIKSFERYQEAKVKVHVVDLGDKRAFDTGAKRYRPVHEFSFMHEEEGELTIHIYLTEAFVKANQNKPSVIAQALLHPLFEKISGYYHIGAVLHEAFYNDHVFASADTAGLLRTGPFGSSGPMSDLTRFMMDEAFREGQWNYLRRLLRSYQFDSSRYPGMADPETIEAWAQELSDDVTKIAREHLSLRILTEEIKEHESDGQLEFYPQIIQINGNTYVLAKVANSNRVYAYLFAANNDRGLAHPLMTGENQPFQTAHFSVLRLPINDWLSEVTGITEESDALGIDQDVFRFILASVFREVRNALEGLLVRNRELFSWLDVFLEGKTEDEYAEGERRLAGVLRQVGAGIEKYESVLRTERGERVSNALTELDLRGMIGEEGFDVLKLWEAIDLYQEEGRALTEGELDLMPELIRAKVVEAMLRRVTEYEAIDEGLRSALEGLDPEQKVVYLLEHVSEVNAELGLYARALADIDQKIKDGSFETLKALTFRGQTDSIFVTATRELREVAHLLEGDVEIDRAMLWKLAKPELITELSFEVPMDDGRMETFEGWRVQHNSAKGPPKGGLRFHPTMSRDMAMGLSSEMTWKTAVFNLPYGGGKGGIRLNPRKYSKTELSRISRAFFAALSEKEVVGPRLDIPAPDVNTNPEIMAWMEDAYIRVQMNKGHISLGEEGLAVLRQVNADRFEEGRLYLDPYYMKKKLEELRAMDARAGPVLEKIMAAVDIENPVYDQALGGYVDITGVLTEEEIKVFYRENVYALNKDPFIFATRDTATPYLSAFLRYMEGYPSDREKPEGFGAELAVLTAKPIEMGGSEGRTEATGLGVFYATELAAKNLLNKGLPETSVAVQGFGNVGSYAAKLLYESGAHIIRVSEWNDALRKAVAIENAEGLDIIALMAHVKETGSILGFPGAREIDAQVVLVGEVDVLIPAAMGGVITEEVARQMKAFIVVEGANSPLTTDGDRVLVERGIYAIPDILANGNGVTGSYFEWHQNLHLEHWTFDRMVSELRRKMYESFANVHEIVKQKGVPFRKAAYIYAMTSVIQAELQRRETNLAQATTKKVMGEDALSVNDVRQLKALIASSETFLMDSAAMERLGIYKVLDSRAPPDDLDKEDKSLRLLHDTIAEALKTGEAVTLPRPIVSPLDPSVELNSARVEVHVVQRDTIGFRLPWRKRPIYEWTEVTEEDGLAVIKVYVTKGFMDHELMNAQVLTQTLVHPLVERIGSLTHLEAVQQESFYHSEQDSRENAQDGRAVLSDLTRWIIHERYHDRDWEFLHQMTEPWRLDWDRYGNIIESAEKSRAYGLSMLVTDEVMSVIGDDEEMINTILMNVTQRHMLLNFLVKILRRVEEGEYNPDLLTSIMNNPVFDTSMIRSIAGVLSVDEDIRVQLIKDYENRLADQLRDKRISVSLSGQIEFATRTDDANHLDLLDALEEYPQWLQDKRDMLIQKANRRPQWFHRMLLWFSGDYPFMKGLITSEQILRLPIRIVRGLEARPIQLVDGKLELSAASLQNGREDLYRTLLAQSVKTISSRLKTRPEKRVEVQKLIRDRLHQIKEGDLVPLDSSVLSIIGGEERLRGWFQQVKDQLPKDVTYDFANIERVLNTGRVFFVMPEVGSLGLVSSPDAFLTPLMTGHIVQATDIEGLEGAIIQEGDILIDYGVIDVLLTRADLTENKQERNAYWLSAFSILLEFVHQTESGRADPSITQQIQDALPVPESWDPYSVAYILGGIENRHKEYYRAIQQFTEQLGSIQLDGLDGYDAVRIDWTRAALIFERDNEVLATFQLESPLAINTIFESLNQVGIQGVRFIIHQPGDLSPLVKWFHKIALGVAFNNISEGVAASQVLMGLNGDVVLISRTRDGIDIDPSPENILDIAPNVAPTRAQPESREALRALASSA